jgi:hypothetical protein
LKGATPLKARSIFHIPPHLLTTTSGHIPRDRTLLVLVHLPRALQPPDGSAHFHALGHVNRPQHHDAERLLRIERGRAAELSALQEHLEDAPVDNALKAPRVGEEVVGRELVREERVLEAPDVAAIDEERCVTTEVEAERERFPGAGSKKGDVERRGAGNVGRGNVRNVDGEVNSLVVQR